MTELTHNDLDSHGWAARASAAWHRPKVAARIEAIRSHQKSRTTSHCRTREKLACGGRASSVMILIWLFQNAGNR
jgi:hypothetical protein